MKVIVGKTAGFCYGVNRAVSATMEELKKPEIEKKIYCLGELVHNRQVVEKVQKLGAETIEELSEIPQKENVTVVIRAHGVPPKIYQQIKEKNYTLLDLTCPNVLAIHRLAETASKENQYIFIIGHKKHPEVIGIYGYCKEATIIETEEDIENAIQQLQKSNRKKVCILSQTTFSLEKFQQYIEQIENTLRNIGEYQIEIKSTICNATKLRQEETEKIAKEVQYMIVIGGKNSSNTKKLYEIAHHYCTNTECIETVKDLNLEIIKQLKNKTENRKQEFKVGIMAGASTPKESIEEVNKAIDIL